MTAELTRRRNPEAQQACWHIYYGDVQVGTIGERVGVPRDVDQWGWSCGFYPRAHRGERSGETAETFDQARPAFEAAWAKYLPGCIEADFEEYRRQRDFTAWKYRMFDLGLPLPTQTPSGISRCFCGAEIDNKTLSDHVSEHHAA